MMKIGGFFLLFLPFPFFLSFFSLFFSLFLFLSFFLFFPLSPPLSVFYPPSLARLPVKQPARFLCMVCCLLFSCSGLMAGNALATGLCYNLIVMHVICELLSTVFRYLRVGWGGTGLARTLPLPLCTLT